MNFNYSQRRINEGEESSEDERDTSQIVERSEESQHESEIENEEFENEEKEEKESVSVSEDFEEYKRRMLNKSQKSLSMRLYNCFIVGMVKKTIFNCIYSLFDIVCCDEECFDKMDCFYIESCNEDGICDCEFDEDDCC